MFGAMTSLTGGGGMSGSSEATGESGNIGGSQFEWGGIGDNAGTVNFSNKKDWIKYAGMGAVVVAVVLIMKKG